MYKQIPRGHCSFILMAIDGCNDCHFRSAMNIYKHTLDLSFRDVILLCVPLRIRVHLENFEKMSCSISDLPVVARLLTLIIFEP